MLATRMQGHPLASALSISRNGRCFCPALRRGPPSPPRQRWAPAASAETDRTVSLPYQTKPGVEASLNECLYSAVEVDNAAHPLYTTLTVQGPDTPGLLRVLSWVLNGMSVRVQHGLLETTPEGLVRDTMWVTDFRGRKLKDSSAESLRARLEDFLVMCESEVAVTQHEWHCGNIWVSNNAHPDLTEVVVHGEPSAHKPGFLLELTTALTAAGGSIVEGAIQGDAEAPVPGSAVAPSTYDFRAGRYFKFMLKGPTGRQMDAHQVASLIFTLRLLQGKGSMPTVAPNMDALLR
ncbi:hypothetical protein PLESTB_000185600 [Pleodorina starrii]|uniref:ACT domain-containing protein n=1 Tax=Pleodorina starrii TaxID=330485 RepID=A0A9W6BBS2_9CHLO|nr:hypothetical protein PLESTM_000511300 [Pleodorina starrii]GLC49129.1 hypothetical protein PLESTB_000185600 [Pleodorina starrii]GLC66077.1 hypothetical protein PLESTF_000382200 [Pleodorina starrii]